MNPYNNPSTHAWKILSSSPSVSPCHAVCLAASHPPAAVVSQVSNEASTLLAEMVDFNAVATGSNLDQLSNNVNVVSQLGMILPTVRRESSH
jgi:hypothetical protein